MLCEVVLFSISYLILFTSVWGLESVDGIYQLLSTDSTVYLLFGSCCCLLNCWQIRYHDGWFGF